MTKLDTLIRTLYQDRRLRYIVATGLSFSLTLFLSFSLKSFLGMPEKFAVAATLFIVFFINFYTNRVFVFRSKANARRQIVYFAASSIAFRVVDYSLFFILFSWSNVHYLWALSSALVITFIVKYFFQKAIIFR